LCCLLSSPTQQLNCFLRCNIICLFRNTMNSLFLVLFPSPGAFHTVYNSLIETHSFTGLYSTIYSKFLTIALKPLEGSSFLTHQLNVGVYKNSVLHTLTWDCSSPMASINVFVVHDIHF